jgi:hypothetical protein
MPMMENAGADGVLPEGEGQIAGLQKALAEI